MINIGEQEIIELLEKERFPLSLNEICLKLPGSDNSNNRKYQINKVISKLVKHGEVKYVEIDHLLSMKFLNCKRSIRLYYC